MECGSIFIAALVISVIAFLPVSGKMGSLLYEQASAGTAQSADSKEEDGMMAWEMIDAETIESDIAFQAELSPAIILFSGLGGLVLIGGSMSMAFFFNAHHTPKELLATME